MSTSQQEDPSSPTSQGSNSPHWRARLSAFNLSDINPLSLPHVSGRSSSSTLDSSSLDLPPAQPSEIRTLPQPTHRPNTHDAPCISLYPQPSTDQPNNDTNGKHRPPTRKSQSTSAIPYDSPSSSDIAAQQSLPALFEGDVALPTDFKRRVKTDLIQPKHIGSKNDSNINNNGNSHSTPLTNFEHHQQAHQASCGNSGSPKNILQCLCGQCKQKRRPMKVPPVKYSSSEHESLHPGLGPGNEFSIQAEWHHQHQQQQYQQPQQQQQQHQQVFYPQHIHLHVHPSCQHNSCSCKNMAMVSTPLNSGAGAGPSFGLDKVEHQSQVHSLHVGQHEKDKMYPQPFPPPPQQQYPPPIQPMQHQNQVFSELPPNEIAPVPQAAEEFKIPPPPLEILRSKQELKFPVTNLVSTNDNFVPSGRRSALIVGIVYATSEQPLRGCVSDVREIYSLLRNIFGFHDSEIVILCDVKTGLERVVNHGLPTHQEILNALRILVSDTQPGDSLWFSFSGHGRQIEDENGDEVVDGRDETLLPVDYESSGDIIDDELYRIVTSICPGSRLTALIDACSSGTVLDLPYCHKLFRPGTGEFLSPHVGHPVFMNSVVTNTEALRLACRDDQKSQDTDGFTGKGKYVGAMTHSFIDAIRETYASGWRYCSYRDLLQRIFVKLRSIKITQTPQFCTSHLFNFDREFRI